MTSLSRLRKPEFIFHRMMDLPIEIARIIHENVYGDTLRYLLQQTYKVRRFIDDQVLSFLRKHYAVYGYRMAKRSEFKRRNRSERRSWQIVFKGWKRTGCSGDFYGSFMVPEKDKHGKLFENVGIAAFIFDRFCSEPQKLYGRTFE